jgi:hypothetical protein
MRAIKKSRKQDQKVTSPSLWNVKILWLGKNKNKLDTIDMNI